VEEVGGMGLKSTGRLRGGGEDRRREWMKMGRKYRWGRAMDRSTRKEELMKGVSIKIRKY
jgi:hypothetical protein